MNLQFPMFKSKIAFLGLAAVLLTACGGDNSKGEIGSDELPDNDTAKTALLNVDGELFSVPSPIQTAMLIQKSGVPYNKAILNPPGKHGQYTSGYTRALNLGIYGADLGYVSMYSQMPQDAIGYLASVKQLADKLGVSSAFDRSVMKRIETNIGSKDSMLMLVGVAYRASDAYLKTNKRTEVSSLILTGGWVESMYFSVTAYEAKQSNDIKNRIAEQKQALGSIIKLLNSHNMPEAQSLMKQLEELAKIYDGIQFKYTYVEPVTDSVKKMTYINSTTEVNMSQEQLEQLASKIKAIRTTIVNSQS